MWVYLLIAIVSKCNVIKYKCMKCLLCDCDRRGSVIVITTLAHPIRESQCVSKNV